MSTSKDQKPMVTMPAGATTSSLADPPRAKRPRSSKLSGGEEVFRCPLEEFLEKPKAERRRLFDVAERLNRPSVERFFADHPEADWVVVAVKPGKVIDSGPADEEPYEAELMERARRVGLPVFTYVRAGLVEELPAPWHQITALDYYPTLTLKSPRMMNAANSGATSTREARTLS